MFTKAKEKLIEVYNEAGLKLGIFGSLPNTYGGLLHICAKKGGRIILGISKKEPIDTSSGESVEGIVEIGGGAVPYLAIKGICNAEQFNGGMTGTIEIGDKILTIKGGAITKVEDKK